MTPSAVTFAITEDTAVFYAEIYGEIRALSPTLRVLDRVNREDIDALGLIRLRMPEIQSAMAGRVIRFREEKYTRQIRDITAKILTSSLKERITTVDLRNPYQALRKAISSPSSAVTAPVSPLCSMPSPVFGSRTTAPSSWVAWM